MLIQNLVFWVCLTQPPTLWKCILILCWHKWQSLLFKWSLHTLFCFGFFFMFMFQPHHALILAYLESWASHLEGFWLEFCSLERCGLSKLKQVNVWLTIKSSWLNIDLNWNWNCPICLIQDTQLVWTLARLRQTFLVRNFYFLVIGSFIFFPSFHLIGLSLVFSPGCPCSGAKRQPVSTNPSPSENSSANASIGSTQSTPTSSMAWDYGNLHHQQGHHLPSKSPIWVLCFFILR